MSIQEKLLKLKGLSQKTEYQLAILIAVVAAGSFMLGRFSHEKMTPLETTAVEKAQITSPSVDLEATVVASEEVREDTNSDSAPVVPSAGSYVGSINSTKYHLPWCAGAKQIKEENKIWFATKEDAAAAGYSPAANCKGI